LIGGDIPLGLWTGLALDRSILDDQDALSLLTVHDDRLDNAFLRRLRECRNGTSQYTDD